MSKSLNNCIYYDCTVCDSSLMSMSRLTCDMSQNEIEIFQANINRVVYKKGETITKQGSDLRYVACLEYGFVKQYYEVENGNHIIYNILTAPSIIGFTDLFTHSPVNFTTTALSESRLCLIPISNIEKLIELKPSFAKNILEYINKKNEVLASKIISFTQKTMQERVAELLMYFHNHHLLRDNFFIHLTRQECAEMCLISREAFSRVLKEFRELGIIESSRNHIKILDSKSLASYLPH